MKFCILRWHENWWNCRLSFDDWQTFFLIDFGSTKFVFLSGSSEGLIYSWLRGLICGGTFSSSQPASKKCQIPTSPLKPSLGNPLFPNFCTLLANFCKYRGFFRDWDPRVFGQNVMGFKISGMDFLLDGIFREKATFGRQGYKSDSIAAEFRSLNDSLVVCKNEEPHLACNSGVPLCTHNKMYKNKIPRFSIPQLFS